MASEPNRRIGRPPKEVTGRDGKKIVGLSLHKAKGAYYATYSNPRRYFGKDFDRALISFREWQDQQTEAMVEIVNPRKLALMEGSVVNRSNPSTVVGGSVFDITAPKGTPQEQMIEWFRANFDKLRPLFQEQLLSNRQGEIHLENPRQQIPEDLFWATFRQKMQESPQLCSEKSGYPLDRLHQFKQAGPSIPLMTTDDQYAKGKLSVGQIYFTKPEKMSHQGRRDAKFYWQEFTDFVEVDTVAELTPDHFRRFKDDVYARMKAGGFKPTFVRHRFTLIRTILNYSLTAGVDTDHLNRVLSLSRMLIKPKKQKAEASPISRKDFHAIVKATDDVKFKAMWLCMLNFSMKPKEISELGRNEVDLVKKVLVTDRGKTGMTRIAVVWDRTIEAIKKYLKEQPHNAPTLFANKDGEPFSKNYGGSQIADYFRIYRQHAKRLKVKAEDLRDGAYTAAIEGGADITQARLVAGHSLGGMSDEYVRRNPRMVAKCCEIIEAYYFGKQAGE